MTVNFIVNAVCLLALTVSALFSCNRQVQMLQQNSYYPSRYVKWFLKGSRLSDKLLPILYLLIVLSPLADLDGIYFSVVSVAAILLLRILIAVRRHRASIKKLVWTARVKRLFATASAILLLFACGVLFAPASGVLFVLSTVAFSVLCAFTPALVMLARTLNVPMEHAVSNWYINDAKRILKSTGAKVIGVTGSFGKTGTKFILGRILSEKYNTVVTPESFNTTMGVVRTIREKVTPATEIFVAEMGAKNVGDIKEICDLVSPSLGIITAVGAQHLETFKTLENVQKTKFELADAVKANGGTVVLNFNSAPVALAAAGYVHKGYGTDDNADVKITDITVTRDGSEFTVMYEGESIRLQTKLLGLHNVLNITGAVTVALMLGVEPSRIAYAVKRLQPVSHRLELKPFINGSLMLDDAYNSNPEGCLQAVEVLSAFHGMKKIIVTPGLVELGELEYESNYRLGKAAAACCDMLVFVGKDRAVPMVKAAEDSGYSKDKIRVVETFAEAVNVLQGEADANSVILVENDLPDVYKK